ncbi:MAG: hypothetical protein IIZ04_00330, partial [Aeriscardovia sp.]|nr:hypothetical protein [Aeriscardovia sp.]
MALISTLKAKKGQTSLPHRRRTLHLTFSEMGSGWKIFAKRRWKFLIFCLALAALLEIFIFNLPFWETISASPSFETFSSSNTQGLAMDSKNEAKKSGREVVDPQVNIDLQSKTPIKFVRLIENPGIKNTPGMEY